MKRYLIERDIPQVGSLDAQQIQAAAARSNRVLRELGTDIQWLESFVSADKLFCIYLAENEAVVEEHAQRSGFQAKRITEIVKVIDPSTGHDGSSHR
jgi:hypothetical protein